MMSAAKSVIVKLISASVGVGGIQLIDILPMDSMPDGDLIKAICQAVVAIVAVIAILKKKKDK